MRTNRNSLIILLVFLFSSTTFSAQFSDREINEMMVDVANEYARNLPQVIDAETTVIGIIAGGNRDIIYKYQLSNMEKNDPGFSLFVSLVRRKHINNFCTQPMLEIYRKENITMAHNFVDWRGNYLFELRINNSYC